MSASSSMPPGAPRLLLLGKDGQVGWELQRALAPLGEVTALGRNEADLSRPETLRALVRDLRPAAVVNAAAYTAVDRAETEPDLAEAVNATAPGVLAEECDRLGAWLVHYSTDYVFDGKGTRPYREDDATGPLNTYGRTKLAGERAILDRTARCLVFRTSWVYGLRGDNFARKILRLAADRDALTVVDDQHGTPTGADLIADITAHALPAAWADATLAGLYHLTAAGSTTWHAYACRVLEEGARLGFPLKARAANVAPILTRDLQTRAQRPLYSCLDSGKLRERLQLHLPHWETGVCRMLGAVAALRTASDT